MSTSINIPDRLPTGYIPTDHWRTLAKTAGYRVLMVVTTIVVAFAVTNDVGSAVNIGIATNVIKTLTYYGYERLWARISWGRLPTQ